MTKSTSDISGVAKKPASLFEQIRSFDSKSLKNAYDRELAPKKDLQDKLKDSLEAAVKNSGVVNISNEESSYTDDEWNEG